MIALSSRLSLLRSAFLSGFQYLFIITRFRFWFPSTIIFLSKAGCKGKRLFRYSKRKFLFFYLFYLPVSSLSFSRILILIPRKTLNPIPRSLPHYLFWTLAFLAAAKVNLLFNIPKNKPKYLNLFCKPTFNLLSPLSRFNDLLSSESGCKETTFYSTLQNY